MLVDRWPSSLVLFVEYKVMQIEAGLRQGSTSHRRDACVSISYRCSRGRRLVDNRLEKLEDVVVWTRGTRRDVTFDACQSLFLFLNDELDLQFTGSLSTLHTLK